MDFKKKYLKYKYKYLKLKQLGGDPPKRIIKEIEELKKNQDIRVVQWNDKESELLVLVNDYFFTFNFDIDKYPFIAPKLSVNFLKYHLSNLYQSMEWNPTTTIESIIIKYFEREKNPQKFDQELKNKIAAEKISKNDKKIAADAQKSEFGTSEEDQKELLKQFETMKLEKERKETKDLIFRNLINKLLENYVIISITFEDYYFKLKTRREMSYPLNLKIELTDKFPYTVLLTETNKNNKIELKLRDVITFLNNEDNRKQLFLPRKVSTKI